MVKELRLEVLEEPSIDKVGIKSGHNYLQIMSEVNKLLKKGIVIFLKLKPDETNRVILNLKNLVKTLKYNHFKMEQFIQPPILYNKVIHILKIDLKDAYLLLYENIRCFAGSKLLKFVLLPNKDPYCCFKGTLVQI